MWSLQLSVVVPTRNRPESIRRLLRSLSAQSLPSDQFEVIVVDDGSEPPLRLVAEDGPWSFSCRVIHRDADHGAHASRWAGLRAASGERILFLDDDVIAEPQVLRAHASPALGERIALGPILYPDQTDSTPYFRYMASFYMACYLRVIRNHELAPAEYYVCNSSGPRATFLTAFEVVSEHYPHRIVGAEFDESLLARVHAMRSTERVFLSDAMLWHADTSSLAEALSGALQSGQATGRLVVEGSFPNAAWPLAGPILGPSIPARLRRFAMYCFWALPRPCLLAAQVLATVAERGPRRFVPRWICHAPLRLARWEGMRSVCPSFNELIQLLVAARVE